MNIKVRFAACI